MAVLTLRRGLATCGAEDLRRRGLAILSVAFAIQSLTSHLWLLLFRGAG